MIHGLGYRGELADAAALSAALASAGLSADAARAKAALFGRAATALPERAARAAWFVPGRIEILGKHTDYAGGQSLVAAVERGFAVVAAPREDGVVRVIDALRCETVELELAADATASGWGNYPATTVRRVARNFPEARRGVEIALASDLPAAAGMSSSSALMIGMFLALAHANDLWCEAAFRANISSVEDLAGYLATIENGQTFGALAGERGVGTFGGSEDHTTILCARAGQVSRYAYAPVRFLGTIGLPGGYTLAVGASGVVAEKTGAAREGFNAAARLASEVAELWRRETGSAAPHLAAILAESPAARDALCALVAKGASAAHAARLEHFCLENEEILPGAAGALARGDVGTFGALVDRSQRAAEELLGNQIEETSYLAAQARELGAAATSAFGAGFGGSVWTMVESEKTETFLARWSAAYAERFPEHAAATFFSTAAGPAAFAVF